MRTPKNLYIVIDEPYGIVGTFKTQKEAQHEAEIDGGNVAGPFVYTPKATATKTGKNKAPAKKKQAA